MCSLSILRFITSAHDAPYVFASVPHHSPAAMTEHEAKQQVKDEKEFYGHLASYLVCNAAFVAMSLATGTYWFIFPFFFWGIGLANHASRVFGLPGRGGEWEDRRMRELLGRDETQAGLDALRKQLHRLEHGERTSEQTEESEAVRLRRRIENLEAIVTSRDWDLLDDNFRRPTTSEEIATPESLLNDVPDAEDHADRTERLARRVR